MRLLKLEMENFGPYFGHHEVDLRVGAGTPVILIHGENGRGKSSLYSAISWCLYQTTLDRRGRSRPTYSLMSYDALDQGANFMGVTLEFESGGLNYRLERHAEATTRPRTDSGLSVTALLRRDGHFVPAADVRRVIADVLHPDISRFFLFDGEMLAQYERLVDEPGKDSHLVRESIERILGVPALQLMWDDLGVLRATVERQQVAAMRASKRNEALVEQIQKAEDELSSLNEDLERFEGVLQIAEEAQSSVSAKLEQYVDVRSDAKQIAELQERRTEEGRRIGSALESLRHALSEGWWVSTTWRIGERLGQLQEEVVEAHEHVRSDVERRLAAEQVAASLAEGRCTVCGQLLSAVARTTLQGKGAGAQEPGPGQRDADDRVEDAIWEQGKLRPFDRPDLVQRVVQSELEWRQARLRHRSLGTDIEAIQRRLRESPLADIGSLERELESVSATVRSVREELDQRRVERDRSAKRLQDLRRDIQKTAGANPRIAAQFGVYSALQTTFEKALSEFRHRVKRRVELVASEIFTRLSTETEYAELRINDQYGLQIVGPQGRVIPEISAGYAQIVALSLVGALNRCATREGPVVMDSPLGRLDAGHRDRVLRYVPSMGDQVVLLVQSREFDRDRDLPSLGSTVSREYVIRRAGLTASEIVPQEG